jgi:acetylornithine deacetylase/succinyl-diaminopimelate desuccinylase-like protein
MKGPDAALVYGLTAAIHAGSEKLTGQVRLVLTADEEGKMMEGARYLVQQGQVQAHAALIAEPSGVKASWETIPLISRGASVVRFVVEGTPTHSSIGDRLPVVNASLEASHLMVFLGEHLTLQHPRTDLCPQGPTVNLGATLRGGQAVAMVSGQAEFSVDIRTLPGMSQEQVARDIDRALAAFCAERPQSRVTWNFFPGSLAWLPPTEIAPDLPLVHAVRQAAGQVLGEPPPFGCFPGTTDAVSWQAMGGIPTIPGFGPGLLSNCHKPDEFVEIDEVIQAAKIYALTILNYLGET